MDAMDILGSILGRRSKSRGSGGRILKDIFGQGGSGQPQQETRQREHHPVDNRSGSLPRGSRSDYQQNDAHDLEDLLRVSRQHHSKRRGQSPPAASPPPRVPERNSQEFQSMNQQSEVLVRAMVNAAKSDGQIDKDEQNHILGELDHVTQEELDFLRSEFKKPLDAREFAWSVPMGMEQKVYGVSLMSIDLDEQKEAKYLADLAHGLRIPPDACNQIHRRFNAPEIFRT